MISKSLRLVTRRTLETSLRSKWFVVYCVTLLAGGSLFAGFGLGDTMIYGYRGFAKAMAGFVHLSLLFIPIMALVPAIAVLADERETGALEYILSYPITAGEVFVGKWVGIGTAVTLAALIGFGGMSAIAALRGVPFSVVGTLLLFVILITWVFVGLGLTCAAVARSRVRATTVAVAAWLVFVALGTMGIMAAFVRWGLPSDVLVGWSFLNPVEAFRLGVVTVLDPDLSVLGPVGAKLVSGLGAAGTVVLAAGSVTAWALGLPFVGWLWCQRRRLV